MARKRKNWDAAAIATKWVQGMSSPAAMANYAAGTQGKGAATMQAAAQHIDDYQAGVQQAVANGTVLKALQDPQAAQLYDANTGQKGAAQLGPGAQKKKAKYAAQVNRLTGVWAQMQQAANQADPTASRGTAAQRAAAALQVLMASGKKAGS